MLIVIIDVYLTTNMADYRTLIFRQNPNDSNFNKSSRFCNIVCGKDTSIGPVIFILMLNPADVIGDQSDVVTQNAWFLCALCAAISGEISILIQTWGRFPVPRICRWESNHMPARKLSCPTCGLAPTIL